MVFQFENIDRLKARMSNLRQPAAKSMKRELFNSQVQNPDVQKLNLLEIWTLRTSVFEH